MELLKKIHYTPEVFRLAATHFIEAMGVLSGIVTLIAATTNSPLLSFKWMLLVCGGVCMVYTCWRLWPTQSVNIYLAPRKIVKIVTGDLFTQNGIIVVPVNNYFDMTTERDVIGESSIHGQFIKLYTEKHKGDGIDINEEIKKTLVTDGIMPISKNEQRVFPRNFHRYDVGTVARLFDSDKTYYLTVLSEFDDKNHIIKQPEKFGLTLQRMLRSINIYRSGHDVYMPVMGAGMMNMPMRLDEMIEFIIDNIKFCSDYSSNVGCIYIVIREEDLSRVSLRVIQSHKSSIFNRFYQ